jgi:hypothetical protein
MFNRLNATEDGQLIGRIEEVKLEYPSVRGEYIQVITKTPVGNKGASFTIPDTPTDDDDIVRLCKAKGVDPKYPSMLEGCEVRWDGDELVIPKTRKQKIIEPIDKALGGMDTYSRLKIAFFLTFLPITLTTYYLVLHRVDRHHMRQSLEDFGFHMLIWSAFLALILAVLIPTLVTLL